MRVQMKVVSMEKKGDKEVGIISNIEWRKERHQI
jgi:hypothetical protein